MGIFAPQLVAGVDSCGASFVMGPHFCEGAPGSPLLLPTL